MGFFLRGNPNGKPSCAGLRQAYLLAQICETMCDPSFRRWEPPLPLQATRQLPVNLQLSVWILPPLMIRALGAHCQRRTSAVRQSISNAAPEGLGSRHQPRAWLASGRV
jgi:hypothetical protein